MSLVKFHYYKLISGLTNEQLDIFLNSFVDDVLIQEIHKSQQKKYFIRLIKQEQHDEGKLYSFQVIQTDKNIKDYREVKETGDINSRIKLEDENSGLSKISKEMLSFLIFKKGDYIRIMCEDISFGIGINSIKYILKRKLELDQELEIITRLIYGNEIIEKLLLNKNKKLKILNFKPYRNVDEFNKIEVLEDALEKIKEHTQEMFISLTWDKRGSKTLFEIFQDFFSVNETFENFDFSDFLKVFNIELEDKTRINLKDDILNRKTTEDKEYYLETENNISTLFENMVIFFKEDYADDKLN